MKKNALQLSFDDVRFGGQCVIAQPGIEWSYGMVIQTVIARPFPIADCWPDVPKFEPMNTRRWIGGVMTNEMAQSVPVWVYRP